MLSVFQFPFFQKKKGGRKKKVASCVEATTHCKYSVLGRNLMEMLTERLLQLHQVFPFAQQRSIIPLFQ